MLYKGRSPFVNATRWLKPADHPAVEEHGESWGVLTPEGWREVRPGDWIVTDVSGFAIPMSHELFVALYEPFRDICALTEREIADRLRSVPFGATSENIGKK